MTEPRARARPSTSRGGSSRPAAGPPLSAAAHVDDSFFRHLVTHMRNGVLAISRSGELLLINHEACRVFGLPLGEDYLGRAVSDVFAPHPDIVRLLGTVFDVETLPNRAELRLKPSGKVIGYTLSFIRNGDQVLGAALFVKDLTRVEQLEERERLRDRLAALGEMAAAMAHEIKNPLAGIEVMAGLLRRQVPESPEAQGILADIINEAKMANAIVQEVLDFVRPVRPQMERTSVAHAITSAVVLADSKASRGEVRMDVDVPEDLPLIQGDRHQLVQIFANLLINAYEALEGRGEVHVRVRLVESDEDGALHLDGVHPVPTVQTDVTDTGPGIPPEVADKIFRAFFTTKAQGSGLGLAIVRKIIDAHDGRIECTSRPGEGTRFRVLLPVSSEPPAAPRSDHA